MKIRVRIRVSVRARLRVRVRVRAIQYIKLLIQYIKLLIQYTINWVAALKPLAVSEENLLLVCDANS